MKTTKVFTVFFTILLFANVLYAGNLPHGNVDTKANMMVEKLCKTLVLSDNQKSAIKAKAKIYMTKIEKANNLKVREELIAVKEEMAKEYLTSLDSILTSGQREQLNMKRKEYREARINKFQKK